MAQTYADWELLVIDDGSEDNSVEIVKKVSEGDERIKIFYRKHGGVAAVRNFGLSHAEGEYIAFIDSDDIWPDYYLEYLHFLIKKYDAGIASGIFVRFEDGHDNLLASLFKSRELLFGQDSKKRERYVRERILTAEEAVKESMYQKGVVATMCGKLFRRSLFVDVRFREGELYEDLDVFYQVAMKCLIFIESDCPVYGYRQRRGSILHTFGINRLVVLEVTRRMCEYVEHKCSSLLPAAIDRRFSANFNMLALMLQHDKITGDKDEYYLFKERECREYIRKYALKELLNPRVRLKNKIGAVMFMLLPRKLFNSIICKLG